MPADSRPIGALIADVAADVRDIVRGEMRLALAEIVANGLALRRAGVLMVVAGLLAALGVTYLFLSALFALATVMPLWAASLVLAAVALVIAGLAALAGTKSLKGVRGLPRTLAALEETTRWPIQSKH